MTPHQDVIDMTMYMMTRSIQLPDQPLNNLLEGMSSKNVEGYSGCFHRDIMSHGLLTEKCK